MGRACSTPTIAFIPKTRKHPPPAWNLILLRCRPGEAAYSVVCRPDGGILDDVIAYVLDARDVLFVFNASNREADVLVRGKRCPLLGRVTMDLMVIDVSHIEDVDVGDEVALMGRQGNEEIPCRELSDKAGTITWEITTRIGQRVKHVFV